MKNRGFIVFMTVIVTLLCIYYLSFTFVSNGIKDDATAYATDQAGNIDYSKRQNYLDSVYNIPVYNLLGVEFTYKEVQDMELNLGLDLQGGMHVTLEVSPVDIIKGLSGNNEDEALINALETARERQKTSQGSFVDLFYQAFKEQNPDKKLSEFFATSANRDRISFETEDSEVLRIIRTEVDDAIDRSFNILRTRIDRFGTSQPNIQKLENTGRIQIELPGVDNPERVRKLLQGVAKLEFLQVVAINEVSDALAAANEILVAEQKANQKNELGSDDSTETSEESGNLADLLQDEEADTTATEGQEADSADANLDSLENAQNVSPLFSLTRSQYGLVYEVTDTAKINDIIQREDIQALFPRNTRLLWDVKPRKLDDGTELLELYVVRTQRGNQALLTGEVVNDARQTFDEVGQPAVDMSMDPTGARKWAKITRENINNRIAIVLDNYVYSAPNVTQEIPNGKSIISGNFTMEEAKDLANILKAGSLPAPTRIVEEAIIGPTLGKEARAQGIISIVAGLAMVLIFMVGYYSKGGFIANIALVFNIFFILGILAQLNAALTLPGIAGIVLTIGMSIDANVLIFERIREEMRAGSPLLKAISSGYSKAYSSIVDANVTTFLTGAILYWLGQGPVKGFAITLMIGIACSFFSAVFITRVIVSWMSKKGDQSKISFATPFSKNLLNNISFNFMSKRKMAYIGSGIVIVIGIVLMVTKGLTLGVDFTGGRSYVVRFAEQVETTSLKVALDGKLEDAGTEVKTYGANNILKVTTSYLVNEESTEADNTVKTKIIDGIAEATGMSYVETESAMGDNDFTISGSSKVGATIADDIRNSSQESVIFALIAIFIYILIRFRRWQFGLGAVVALFHDTLFVLSAFAIAKLLGFSFEIDQVFIAAILTVIGYSINDTVVVFDRIRETLGIKSKATNEETFNTAINNTISRTVMTSLTTLLVILILFIFGGEVLRGFSFALLVGILVGTYSSIFIATPVVLDLAKRKKKAVEA
ncbi:protein translocase subunit SecDF [Marivirga tractuosa]|uniref:Multifunctional fusion protein n=1 Tax=Marivirga tractuosa (strain ATCC 23168 / DSM 4126 / NBRC 15989 / NCIMB 1408 / VKM B-1430 / H-43) TaxID=643867 RepID=E4TTS6_MARTH|nr:protein translocase subunit SecDF [Marivirga tractuosa]ADR21981.1 protein translocase subunit secF;protein translocase subunit secD [Marivirga tractuosa DSM 4126]BDD13559.1 protein translocase subunit SecDF [Marivirga tractuosa]